MIMIGRLGECHREDKTSNPVVWGKRTLNDHDDDEEDDDYDEFSSTITFVYRWQVSFMGRRTSNPLHRVLAWDYQPWNLQ